MFWFLFKNASWHSCFRLFIFILACYNISPVESLPYIYICIPCGSLVQDGVHALGKAHLCSTRSLRNVPSVAFETIPVFTSWTAAFSGPSKEDCWAFPLLTPLLQVIGCVMSLALCQQVVSQAPQHFRSSKMQAICDGCFASSLSAWSFPLTLAHPGQYTRRSVWRWLSKIDTCQSGLPVPFFVANPLNLFLGIGDSSVARTPDSWSKDRGFRHVYLLWSCMLLLSANPQPVQIQNICSYQLWWCGASCPRMSGLYLPTSHSIENMCSH